MRILKLTLVIILLITGLDAYSPLKYLGGITIPFKDINKYVQAVFSPNVFEAFSFKLKNISNIIDHEKFNKDIPTVIYIHGWLSDGEYEESTMAIRSAYRDQQTHNFIAIDWSAFAVFVPPIPYKSSAEKLKKICITIAEQLDLIRTRGCSCYKNFYLVGHSLGAQCAGLIGRHLKKISNNEFIIPKIYALDPAGPGFETKTIGYTGLIDVSVKGFDCISKSDAEYVQVIHSNAGHLGVNKSVGHADFYPNGGEKQPGCKLKSCHHKFAWIFFQQSVRNGPTFWARECDTLENFMNDKCSNNTISAMGYSPFEKPEGKFFLRTHSSQFGTSLGWDGINTKDFSIHGEDGKIFSSLGHVPFMAPIPPDYDEMQKDDLDFEFGIDSERDNNDL